MKRKRLENSVSIREQLVIKAPRNVHTTFVKLTIVQTPLHFFATRLKIFILKSLTRLSETSLQEECFPLRDFSRHPFSRPLTRFSEDIVVYRGESFSVHRVPLYVRESAKTPLPSNRIHNSYILQRP